MAKELEYTEIDKSKEDLEHSIEIAKTINDENGNIGIGTDTINQGTETIAIGQRASAEEQNAIAFGNDSFAVNYSVAIGTEAKSSTRNSVQIGKGTNKKANTAQIFDTIVIDENGKIPANNIGDIENSKIQEAINKSSSEIAEDIRIENLLSDGSFPTGDWNDENEEFEQFDENNRFYRSVRIPMKSGTNYYYSENGESKTPYKIVQEVVDSYGNSSYLTYNNSPFGITLTEAFPEAYCYIVTRQPFSTIKAQLETKNVTSYTKKSGKINDIVKNLINDDGSGGTNDYEDLNNKPSINGISLIDDKTGIELGLQNVIYTPLNAEEEPIDITALNGAYIAMENISIKPIECYIYAYSEDDPYNTISMLHKGSILRVSGSSFSLIDGANEVYCELIDGVWYSGDRILIDDMVELFTDKFINNSGNIIGNMEFNRTFVNGLYYATTSTARIIVPIESGTQSISIRQGGIVVKTLNKIVVIGDSVLVCIWNSSISAYDIINLMDMVTREEVQTMINEAISNLE